MSPPSVTMFVRNNCQRDARVLREAGALAEAGYSVRIIAVLDAVTTGQEAREGFVIDRVPKDPVHYRLFRFLGAGRRGPVRPRVRRWTAWRKRWVLLRRRASHLFRDEELERRVRVGVVDLLSAIFLPLYTLARTKPVRGLIVDPLRRLARRTWGHVRIRNRARRARARSTRTARRLALRAARSVFLLFHGQLCAMDYWQRAYRLARESPTDVYHAHDLNTLPVAWWAHRRLGGKLVYDSHEIYTETTNVGWLDRRFLTVIERFLIRRCDAVITIHDTAAAELARRYRVPTPSVVRNCPCIPPNCERTNKLREATGLKTEDLIALYQGGFLPGRGLQNLVRAMASLPQQMKLVMMGWGKLEIELRFLAAELGLLDRRVLFVPPVPQEELLHWTASADAGVIPYQAVSLNNYYCMPNKLFEYLGAGLPVAASAFPELSRVVDGTSAGVTFDPEDPASIAAAIQAILGDPDARARMSVNARKAALIYNWANEQKKLLEVYTRVTG